MTDLLLKLFTAHILGDFVLQPENWVKHKNKYNLKSRYLYIHAGVHAVVMALLLWPEKAIYWPGILAISTSHLILDALKTGLENRLAKRPSGNRQNSIPFFLEQVSHLVIIAFTGWYYHPGAISFEWLLSTHTALLIAALICATSVSSSIIRILMAPWLEHIRETTDEEQTLPAAGKFIGILERLLIFCFIAINQWQPIGFLFAAKSIFRFGDLSQAKDRKLTEYVLIGTLLSFGMALAIGLLYNHLRDWLPAI